MKTDVLCTAVMAVCMVIALSSGEYAIGSVLALVTTCSLGVTIGRWGK